MNMAMTDLQGDVDEFMDAMGQDIRAWPQAITEPERRLRLELIEEEYDEVIEAIIGLSEVNLEAAPPGALAGRLADLADGIADLIYVLLGTASAYGIYMQDVWSEVHASNMLKTTGPVRDDGKRLKPEGWVPPSIEAIIRQQMADTPAQNLLKVTGR